MSNYREHTKARREHAETNYWLAQARGAAAVSAGQIEWLEARQKEQGALGHMFQFRAIIRAVRQLKKGAA